MFVNHLRMLYFIFSFSLRAMVRKGLIFEEFRKCFLSIYYDFARLLGYSVRIKIEKGDLRAI